MRASQLLYTKKFTFSLANCHPMIIFDDANLDEVLPVAIKGRWINTSMTLAVADWLSERKNGWGPDRENVSRLSGLQLIRGRMKFRKPPVIKRAKWNTKNDFFCQSKCFRFQFKQYIFLQNFPSNLRKTPKAMSSEGGIYLIEFIEGWKCFFFCLCIPTVFFIMRVKTSILSIVFSSKRPSFNHLKKNSSDWYRD